MEKLLKDNVETIFSYALFITGNREKALDLMQDAIVTALSKKHLYKEESHFRSWIFRILKNTYLNNIKRDYIKKEVYLADISKENEDTPSFLMSSVNSLEEINDPILKEKMENMLETMPLEYKDAIILKEIEGLSYEETAQQLQIPVGTVMSRLHRARGYLKKAFRKEAVELKIVSEKVRKNG
ncbi:MAG TPA: RNA polymerase sigma factor [bacterium]|jgi:RNA polymerase sigma-70 factor, ECF subfamily|nr:RNA polymerase sigma factor [bacterium]